MQKRKLLFFYLDFLCSFNVKKSDSNWFRLKYIKNGRLFIIHAFIMMENISIVGAQWLPNSYCVDVLWKCHTEFNQNPFKMFPVLTLCSVWLRILKIQQNWHHMYRKTCCFTFYFHYSKANFDTSTQQFDAIRTWMTRKKIRKNKLLSIHILFIAA